MTSQSRAHETSVSPMSQNNGNMPSMLSPNFNNHSTTSITSEAATFHSARAAPVVEMEHNNTTVLPCKPEPEPSSTIMSRADSGYEPGYERRSTSTSSSRSCRPRHSISSTSPRPANKRASRSTPTSSIHRTSPRPALQSRYTTPRRLEGQNEAQSPYQFFQFPSLSPPTPPTSSELEAPPPPSSHPPPPPATIHYFLLPETRRLEYAAIDAASRGVRGFITKLLPDCILPSDFRRTKFHNGDQDSDAGSVRRYRLNFPDPEEKGVVIEGSQWQNGSGASVGRRETRPGVWRRMMSFGRT
jgi:hypothetical protein